MLPSDVFLPRSNFFRAAKSGRWSAGDAPVDLTDHTTEISNAYMHCVYFRKFLPPVVPSGNVAFTEYFQLHQLADKLGDLDAANLVVDGILSASNARKQVPHERSVGELWTSTAAHSPLRGLLIDWSVHEVTCPLETDTVPHEMLVALYDEFLRLRIQMEEECTMEGSFGVMMKDQGKCHYHQHDDEHPKCA